LTSRLCKHDIGKKEMRVIDKEGEDYLYPAEYFVFVELPGTVEQALFHDLEPA
jgi:hypothetical protein